MNYKSIFLKLTAIVLLISCSNDDILIEDTDVAPSIPQQVTLNKTNIRISNALSLNNTLNHNEFNNKNDIPTFLRPCNEFTYREFLHKYKEVIAPQDTPTYYRKALKIRRENQLRIYQSEGACSSIKIPLKIDIFYDTTDQLYKEIWYFKPAKPGGGEEQDDVDSD
ncbi:RNA-dependent RNA polymerase family protein [Aquimarina agarilytica]|uniref:hypothetical protein n=1 Tax=Aquimarina agarilytica TaxID=1087449 RepID=UPI0002899EB8|nr:hypothetical protein [Aquimarina agarilytica]